MGHTHSTTITPPLSPPPTGRRLRAKSQTAPPWWEGEIPMTRKIKKKRDEKTNVVIIFDGADVQFGGKPINAGALAAHLQGNKDKQVVYRQGARTGFLLSRHIFGNILDLLFMLVLFPIHFLMHVLSRWRHIKDGSSLEFSTLDISTLYNLYMACAFLSRHYRPGAKASFCVFVLGVSKGAYLARTFVDMLQQVGLPPASESAMQAVHLYNEHIIFKQPHKPYFEPVAVHFLGVWITTDKDGPTPVDAPCVSTNGKHVREVLAPDVCHRTVSPQESCIAKTALEATSKTFKQVQVAVSNPLGGRGTWSDDVLHSNLFPNLSIRWMMGEAIMEGLSLNADLILKSPVVAGFVSEAKAKTSAAFIRDSTLVKLLENADKEDEVALATVYLSATSDALKKLVFDTHDPVPQQERDPPKLPALIECQRCGRADVTGRRLDGTNNTFGIKITNIPTFFSLVSEDPRSQLVYYQTGIGTALTTHEKMLNPHKIWHGIVQVADMVFASSLGDHVMQGYEFLMNHYRPGDQIFLFGFSRGAFTARALVGMLEQVGLLPVGNKESIPLAYSIYKNSNQLSKNELTDKLTMSQGFKRTFSREVRVHFVGVWDTVASVGGLWPRLLPFVQSAQYTHVFRHALALDERRGDYSAQVWRPQDDKQDSRGTNVKEVYFPGSHSGVGGGEFRFSDHREPSLENLSLRWMAREAQEYGVVFDFDHVSSSPLFRTFLDKAKQALDSGTNKSVTDYIARCKKFNKHLDEMTAATIFLASEKKAAPYPLLDMRAPRRDHLSLSFNVHLAKEQFKNGDFQGLLDQVGDFLEVLRWKLVDYCPPFCFHPRHIWIESEKRNKTTWFPNRGKSRTVSPQALFHWSVRARMEEVLPLEPGMKYFPAASFVSGERVTLQSLDGKEVE
ncbi:hypothetical protein JCM8547_000763 [Rhodosporidiobolus lusitaniae]